MSNKTITLFIIRDLKKWLVSMYDKPYYMEKSWNNFNEFLKTKHKSCINSKYYDKDLRNAFNNKVINNLDNDKDIFEIRYKKLKSYFEYTQTNKNCVFVKLEYIQNKNNCEIFLKALNKKYELNLNEDNLTTEIPYHCVNMTCEKTVPTHSITNEDLVIIEQNKNDEIEEWVDNLTFEMI